MIECIIAWVLLGMYFFEGGSHLLIASGLFAIASNIYDLRRKIK